MKKVTIGTFASRSEAEKAINLLHKKFDVDTNDISYLYKNTEGATMEVDSEDISSHTPAEGAKKGAVIGGTIGALAGIAAVVGIIPIIGPLVVGGTLATALGLTTAVGTAAAGAVAGAAGGGVLGALTNLGVGKEKAQKYSDRVAAGDILVSVTSENAAEVATALVECGAMNVEVFEPGV
jgi:hypothetical protein